MLSRSYTAQKSASQCFVINFLLSFNILLLPQRPVCEQGQLLLGGRSTTVQPFFLSKIFLLFLKIFAIFVSFNLNFKIFYLFLSIFLSFLSFTVYQSVSYRIPTHPVVSLLSTVSTDESRRLILFQSPLSQAKLLSLLGHLPVSLESFMMHRLVIS